MNQGIRLRTLGFVLILASSTAAVAACWMWFSSVRAWQNHLTDSFVAGVSLYEAIRTGTEGPPGITVSDLASSDMALADKGDFSHLSNIPIPAFVTNVSIIGPSRDPLTGEVLFIGIVSDKMQYAVSELVSNEGQPAAQKFGNVTRLLATYCSDPILFTRIGDGNWQRVDGRQVWGCNAAPRDLRLLAALLSLAVLAVLATLVLDTSSYFDRFARALRNRRQLGGPDSYAVQGPEELRDIVVAVNSYLENEREQLVKRANVLSGVSHDLGAPATRLRLRAALIQEPKLRQQLETDIDSMTEMIESVLTYTRAEMNSELPRQISLTSLVEALVSDYQDVGKPVELQTLERHSVAGGQSIFTSASGHGTVPDTQRILVTARPISLKRAISNLIENALKYGRRASVELKATANQATIVVEDEGSGVSSSDVEAVIAPFKRGKNTQFVDGFGLGLTIVATVAKQHDGRLFFEDGSHGLRACIEIARS